jgi:hypothetical protein
MALIDAVLHFVAVWVKPELRVAVVEVERREAAFVLVWVVEDDVECWRC